MDFTRLFDIPAYQQLRYPQAQALNGPIGAGASWKSLDTIALVNDMQLVGKALHALGIQQGDRVGIYAHCGSPEWLLVDMGMQLAGMVPVPVHATSRADEIDFIFRDADMKAVFVSNADMLAKLEAACAAKPLVIAFEPTEGCAHLGTLMESAANSGSEWTPPLVSPDDLATILYTSGTTGQPKGVMLSHANIVSNVKAVLAITPVNSHMDAISFLPLSHILERMVLYVYMAAGVSVWFVEQLEHLPMALRKVRPHIFTAVPRVLERSHEQLLTELKKAGPLKRRIIQWALALGERYPYAGGGGKPIGYRLKLLVADVFVFRHWRRALGGRLEAIVVGAAALQPRLGRLFGAAGIPVREGYGLTETSPVVSFNRFEPGGVYFGTVGIPVPGVEVRIDRPNEKGEGLIEVRGPNVMLGYYNMPEETAAKFTPDGWLRTGDIGTFEHKRFLKITGRESDVFKTTSGKFVAPSYVEQQLAYSEFVQQSMVLGLNQPHVGALIVPDFEQLEIWCKANKVHWTAPEYMVLNPKVEKLFWRELERINAERLGPVEQIRTFRLITGPWTPENGLLTPTLKLRRLAIAAAYAKEIAQMFGA